MAEEQRAHERHTVWVPIKVENPAGRIEAVCRDGSAGGVLISGRDGLALQLEVGEAVMVTLPTTEADAPLFGRVVRVEATRDGARSIAIEFIRPVPELVERLKPASRPPPSEA